jgi:hypothetical protein
MRDAEYCAVEAVCMETRLASSPLTPERPPMARPHARMFEVESLEGKQLLSTMHVAHHTARQPPALVLNGDLKDPTGKVVYNSDMSQSTENLSGRVKSMGVVTGSVLNYDPYTPKLNDPTIVLTNSKGSVTLGIDQNDTISQTDTGTKTVTKLHYSVESGTGAYAGASGAGVFTLTQVGDGWGPENVDLKLQTNSSR